MERSPKDQIAGAAALVLRLVLAFEVVKKTNEPISSAYVRTVKLPTDSVIRGTGPDIFYTAFLLCRLDFVHVSEK